jgi:streptogrisin C
VLAAALVAPALVAPVATPVPVTAAAVTAPLPVPPPLPVPAPGQSLRERAEQAKQRLDTRGDVPDVLAAWGMDTGSGKLAVDVVGRDTTVATAFLLAAGIDPATVVLRTEAPRNRLFYDLVGGDAIHTGIARCSLGVTARNGAGQRFVLTAGHCTKGSSVWLGRNRVPIGQTRATDFPRDDFGAIAVTNSAWKSTAKVTGGPTIKGSGPATVGSRVCRSGSTTGYRCGVIQALNQTVNYGNGEVVMGLTETNACAEPGDSGGTFITPAGQAQGFTSGGSGDCKTGGTVYFQPLKEALSRYGLTLTTG